ncbi:DUF3592 domain-containing protein [Shewanella corallii]|uniref:DUF3592 domain-containing protein n=1 Tax=Shewanella corallii TaxID=560080 RepID=A0ABT0N6K9_9GAMM|nr:DUF3592 domain-containing protein [Shewanella corallii]MCL2914054.1 DUF3592 domain-containing protein [Shewanella corallii]
MNLPVIAGIVFLLFSLYLMKQSLTSLALANASVLWPVVIGKILSVEVSKPQSTSNHRVLYVKYSYQVDGQEYIGSRDALYTLTGDEVLQLEQQFAESSEVEVFYDPQSPDSAVLITGPREDKKYSDLILAGVGVVVGIGLILAGNAGLIG